MLRRVRIDHDDNELAGRDRIACGHKTLRPLLVRDGRCVEAQHEERALWSLDARAQAASSVDWHGVSGHGLKLPLLGTWRRCAARDGFRGAHAV